MKSLTFYVYLTLAVVSSAFILDANAQKQVVLDKGELQYPNGVKLEIAKSRVEAGQFDLALPLLNKVLADDPKDVLALFIRAAAYRGQKIYGPALSDLNSSMTLKGGSEYKERKLTLRGEIYLAQGNKTAAIADAKAALAHSINFAGTYALMQQLLSPEAFILELTKVIAGHPRSNSLGIPLQYRAGTYLKQGKADLAALDAKAAVLALSEGSSDYAWRILDQHFANKPDLYARELIEIIEASSAPDSPNAIEAELRLANAYINQAKHDLALKHLNRIRVAEIRNERDALGWMLSALAYFEVGRIYEALTAINAVIRSPYHQANAYELRSTIYCATGKKAEAQNDEKKVTSLGRKIERPCQ